MLLLRVSLRVSFALSFACALAACSNSSSGSPFEPSPDPQADAATPDEAVSPRNDAGAPGTDAAVPSCTEPGTTLDPVTKICVPVARTPAEECAARGPKFTFEPVTGRCFTATDYVAQLDGSW